MEWEELLVRHTPFIKEESILSQGNNYFWFSIEREQYSI